MSTLASWGSNVRCDVTIWGEDEVVRNGCKSITSNSAIIMAIMLMP